MAFTFRGWWAPLAAAHLLHDLHDHAALSCPRESFVPSVKIQSPEEEGLNVTAMEEFVCNAMGHADSTDSKQTQLTLGVSPRSLSEKKRAGMFMNRENECAKICVPHCRIICPTISVANKTCPPNHMISEADDTLGDCVNIPNNITFESCEVSRKNGDCFRDTNGEVINPFVDKNCKRTCDECSQDGCGALCVRVCESKGCESECQKNAPDSFPAEVPDPHGGTPAVTEEQGMPYWMFACARICMGETYTKRGSQELVAHNEGRKLEKDTTGWKTQAEEEAANARR